MNTNWVLDTHGDPLGAVRRLVHTLWSQAHLDGMLVPFSDTLEASTRPRLLSDPGELAEFNPFRPLMTLNEAKLVPSLLNSHPHERLGVVVRPCEMRALAEMVRLGALKTDHLLTISVDCLGTFPTSDFQWRAERKGAASLLDQEGLQFARQGGILTYRYRSACQACLSPQAHGADLNIGILGLPVREVLLVSAHDNELAARLGLEGITDGIASSSLVQQRERMLARLDERNARTRAHLLDGLADILPVDLDALVAQFEGCGDCQKCMHVCPICEVDFPQKSADGRYPRSELLDWLVACSGCGMCEQVCPSHQPLSLIFTHIRQQFETAVPPLAG